MAASWPKGVPKNINLIVKKTTTQDMGDGMWQPAEEEQHSWEPYVACFGSVKKAVEKLNKEKGGQSYNHGIRTTVKFYSVVVPHAPTRKQWRENDSSNSNQTEPTRKRDKR